MAAATAWAVMCAEKAEECRGQAVQHPIATCKQRNGARRKALQPSCRLIEWDWLDTTPPGYRMASGLKFMWCAVHKRPPCSSKKRGTVNEKMGPKMMTENK